MITSVNKNSRSCAELQGEAHRLMTTEIGFIDSPEFRNSEIDILNEELPADAYEPASASTARREDGLLSLSGEQYLFRKMNYLKFKANQLRTRLCVKFPSQSCVDQMHAWLNEANEIRGQIVQANLRLIFSLAQKFSASGGDAEELVSEGNFILLNAIDKFDYSRGYRFSTYATHAVQRHFYRVLQRRQKRSQREKLTPGDVLKETIAQEEVVAVVDSRVANELVNHLKQFLNERELDVIQRRYGLAGESDGETLKSISDQLNLSKERVRQVQLRALQKLQPFADQLTVEMDSVM